MSTKRKNITPQPSTKPPRRVREEIPRKKRPAPKPKTN